MASSIISTTIDEAFPVAGQDNDSQGFRDNFNIIKDNFAYAKSEIETLQDDTAKLNAANAFSYNEQSQTVTKETTKTRGSASNSGVGFSQDVNFSQGNFLDFEVQGAGSSGTLQITGWPEVTETQAVAEVVIALKSNTSSSGSTVTLTGENLLGGSQTILTDGNAAFGGSNTVTLNGATEDIVLVKMSTWDRGGRIFLQYLGTYTSI